MARWFIAEDTRRRQGHRPFARRATSWPLASRGSGSAPVCLSGTSIRRHDLPPSGLPFVLDVPASGGVGRSVLRSERATLFDMEGTAGLQDKERALDDPKLTELEELIRRSFRVRENQTPVYVDVSDHLRRAGLDQHQIVFGRRGSGKSCLLIYFRRVVAKEEKIHTIYINGDSVKTLDYPDVLIRLLLAAFEGLPSRSRPRRAFRWLTRTKSTVDGMVVELRELLSRPTTSDLEVTTEKSSSNKRGRTAQLKGAGAQGNLSREASDSSSDKETRKAKEEKVRAVDGRLVDYKEALQDELAASKAPYSVFIIDDFYLINPAHHAEVTDYLHRLLRDTDLYLKISTVHHRTRLSKTDGIRYGVQPSVDVDSFSLDQTLEDLGRTTNYLEDMLRKLGAEVGLEDAPSIMSDDARKDLVLLSGGVPRDYLNVFVDGLGRARSLKSRRWVAPTDLRQAAVSLAQESKFDDLRDATGGGLPALETLFVDLVRFCLTERRKTAFLISKEEINEHPEVHELIQQLMDFKLIHLVEPSTSAASGRPGRYEAYTLDFALFMEPRRRNIEVVKFWLTDDQRRRVRLREAPTYDLSRGARVIEGEKVAAEEALQLAAKVPAAPEGTEDLQLFEDAPAATAGTSSGPTTFTA